MFRKSISSDCIASVRNNSELINHCGGGLVTQLCLILDPMDYTLQASCPWTRHGQMGRILTISAHLSMSKIGILLHCSNN